MISWTPERHDQLVAALLEGKTAAVIAAEMGTTRNAVLGAKHRFKLSAAPTPPKPRPAPPRSGKHAVAPIQSVIPAEIVEPRPVLVHVAPAAPFQHAVSFYDLREGMCRFPNGEPRDLKSFRYCGAPATEIAGGRLTYCAACARRRAASPHEKRAVFRASR